jgi:hypothetical protein
MILPPANSPIQIESEYIRLPARSPDEGVRADIDVFISRKMVEHLRRYGPKRKFYDVQSVPDALEEPTAIFLGLKRTPFDEAYCYSCVPPHRWRNEQEKMPLPPERVFLTYVARLGDHLHVLDWNWRWADPRNFGYPKSWKTDDVRQIWPQTSYLTT